MHPSLLLRSALLSSLLAACAGAEPPPQSPPPPEATAPTPPPAPPAPPAAEPPPAPTAEPPPPPAAEPPAAERDKVPGANLTMGTMEADGVKLKDISCKVDGAMGLLGTLVLAAGFVKRKAQLDGCSRGKVSETTVSWTAAGGQMTRVKADAADARTARCVEKALAGAPAPMPAACRAIVVHGK